MQIYIGIEGFTLTSGFILKEMSICFTNREFRHLLFQQPSNLKLSPRDIFTIRYATQHINRLSFTDGDVPYMCIPDILERYKDSTIFTYGDCALNFLQRYLQTSTIINIKEYRFKMPSALPKPSCFRNHTPRNCSLAKALQIRTFVESISTLNI